MAMLRRLVSRELALSLLIGLTIGVALLALVKLTDRHKAQPRPPAPTHQGTRSFHSLSSTSLIDQAKAELLLTTKSGQWYSTHLGSPGHWTNAWSLLDQAAGGTSPPPPPPPASGLPPLLGTMRLTGSDFSTLAAATKSLLTEAVIGNGATDLNDAQSRPIPLKLIYTLPLGVYAGTNDILGVSQNQAQACGALATTSAGALIKATAYPFYLVQLDNACYQQAFEKHLLAVLQAHPGITGLYYDNVDYDYHNLVGQSVTATQYPDNATWRAKSKAFYAAVNAYFRSRSYYVEGNARAFLAGNAGSNNGSLTNQWWNYLVDASGKSLFSGLAQEFFMESFRYGSGQYTMVDDNVEPWSGWMSNIDTAISLGANFAVAETPRGNLAGDDKIAREARGSMLLRWNGTSPWSVQWRDADALPNDVASYTYNLGGPLGASTIPQAGVSMRLFQSGRVIVNHGLASITQDGHAVASGDAYIGP